MTSLLDRDFVQGNLLDEVRAMRARLDVLERAALTSSADVVVDDIQATGRIEYYGNLFPSRGGSQYLGYIFIPLTAPLTSTSWDGDSYSTTGKTLIDLSAVFGTPAGIKAVLTVVSIRDSGSAANSCLLILSPNDTDASGPTARCSGLTNDAWASQNMVVPCDSNGDIYYQIVASGSSTFDVYLQVWGYWI